MKHSNHQPVTRTRRRSFAAPFVVTVVVAVSGCGTDSDVRPGDQPVTTDQVIANPAEPATENSVVIANPAEPEPDNTVVIANPAEPETDPVVIANPAPPQD